MKVICTFGPFSGGGRTGRKTGRQADESSGNVKVSTSAIPGCNKEAFAKKKEHSGGRLQSHIIS